MNMQIKKQSLTIKIAFATVAFASLLLTPSHAQVTDDFSDGYPGITGNGWNSTWIDVVQLDTGGNPRSTIDVSVETANPLTGAGPRYLFADAALTGTNDNRIAGMTRQFGASGAFDPANPFQVTTFMRMDSVLNSARRLTLDLRKDSQGGATTPNADSAFAIVSGSDLNFTWQFTDGSTNINEFVDSGVGLFQGDTYQVTFDVNPPNNNYSAVIINMDHATKSRSGPASYQTGVLDFINTGAGAIEYFFYSMRLSDSAGADVHEFSLGDISIVPEARHGAFALGLVVLSLMLIVRGRRVS